MADKAKVSRSVVSRIELGQWRGLSFGSLVGVAEALGIRLRVQAAWQGSDLDQMINLRHSLLHEAVAARLGKLPGWALSPEVSYSFFGERGVVDILAWHATTRSLLIVELKTEVVDVNEALGKLDQKRRLAWRIARERRLEPRTVSVWLVVAEGATNRRRVAAHVTVLRSALPIDARTMNAWLRRPHGRVDALSFWSSAHHAGTRRSLAGVRRVRTSARSAS